MKLNSFFTKRSAVVFSVNVAAAFLMAVIPHLGLRANLISPAVPKIDQMQQIIPKLKLKENNFRPKIENFPQVFAGADYESAQAYGVIDLDTEQVLAGKNFSQRLPIASLTKIMTSIVALDLADPAEKFTVSEKASRQVPTKVMLKSGEKYSLEFLLKSALISSANDSAQAIVDGINKKYGQDIFVEAMNKKAEVLGLKNSHFASAEGYDSPDNYSSVEDLSILASYALKYPLIAQIAKEQTDDLTNNGSDMRFYLQNWNGLLGVYPGVEGIKIGNTDQAGYTTVVYSEKEGKKLLAIVLGAPGVLQRDFWTSELLDLGFSKLGLTAANITEDELKAKYASWKYFN